MRNFMFCDCESQIPLSDPELQPWGEFMQTWKLTFANLKVSFGSGLPPFLIYCAMQVWRRNRALKMGMRKDTACHA